jgi:nucleoside diphosphate kinase
MAVAALILEKVVMRSVRREGGSTEPPEAPPTTIRSKGAEADLDRTD